MKSLRTGYPYGLSDRSRKNDKNLPEGHLFFPLSRPAYRPPSPVTMYTFQHVMIYKRIQFHSQHHWQRH